MKRDSYAAVNALWKGVSLPSISRAEAEAAQRALLRLFGRRSGHDRQRANVRSIAVRRCWISSTPNAGLDRGWARLVHDVSHRICRHRHPGFRPHHPQHAMLELEIAEHVVGRIDWLSGSLRPSPKPPADLRALKLAKAEAALVRWDAKLRRAQNAVRKLERRRSALERASSRAASSEGARA